MVTMNLNNYKDPPRIIEPVKDYTNYEISPAMGPTEDQVLDNNILLPPSTLSASVPADFSPLPHRKKPSVDSYGSLTSSRGNPLFQSDIDISKTYDTPRAKWKYRSETCSLSSQNSDADDEDDEPYSTSHLSNTSLPLTPFKNQVYVK
jgi:hypothetical protein